MDTIVLKFGGSSLADNEKLKTVANKIIEFHKRANKIVVVVSAQGKTTDKLIKEAYELSNIPDERELDVLLSSGEQMSMSKLAILLKQLGCDAISLTGWQAGIYTDSKSQESKILNIDTTRINQELEKNKIVIIAGFQGINENKDISTLGRGGSDTTAVAIAAAIKASHCYIFSDVDGVYSTDPNKIPETKKIPELSYLEMVNLSDEGAKVLHNRCVEIAEKYKVLIETRSTFNSNIGTIINEKIEESAVKSIVKNDNFVLVNFKGPLYCKQKIMDICLTLLENGIALNTINNNINVTIENNAVARRVFKLFKEIYGISPSITVRNKKLGRGLTYILNINNKVKEILEDLSIIDNNKYLSIPKEYLISDEEQLRAYLRGVFLVSGSVNDPKTSRYHMEFILDTKEYANFINKLLNTYDVNSKIIKREKNYTVYIKEAEKISDFLRVIKAFSAVMYFEDIRIYRDHKNMTNRLNNCEQANMDKVFMTANKQINDIEKLYELDMVDLLDEKLKTVIEYRMKYKESSLKELAEIMSFETGTEITKSGLNHRFRKIREILDNIENK